VRLPAEWFKAPLDRREGALRGIGWDLDLGADLKPRSELVYCTLRVAGGASSDLACRAVILLAVWCACDNICGTG
jgi:hypothetical protein